VASQWFHPVVISVTALKANRWYEIFRGRSGPVPTLKPKENAMKLIRIILTATIVAMAAGATFASLSAPAYACAFGEHPR